MSEHEWCWDYPQKLSYIDDNKDIAGKMAVDTIRGNIGAGAGICARIGESMWRRVGYVDPRTGKAGIVHQIIGGRPGTLWYKFYKTIVSDRN